MKSVTSGLLPALVSYYTRLETEANGQVASFGFSREKIHFQIVLEPDGRLSAFDDIRERSDSGKPVPSLRLVPDGGGRSGIGLRPFFCWDNTGYALGRDNKGRPERAAEMFSAFRDLHLSFREQLGADKGYAALWRFLESWKPAQAESLPNWEEAAGLNVVFKLRGDEEFIHQRDAVRAAWLRYLATSKESENEIRGISLLTGTEDEIARLHPLISGVAGANAMGAAIVSFNLDAFESYSKSQSYNAPVGTHDAFRYATALNQLLADNSRRVRIGDATVVFWTDRPEAVDAEETFRQLFVEEVRKEESAEDRQTVVRLRSFLDAARQGRLVDQISDPRAPFYVLGLSPNASRLSVRFWLAGTVESFASRLAEHAAQLEMIGARPDDPPLAIRRLLAETAREPKDVAPQLAGEVARSVLGGIPYPQILFSAVIRRIRADSNVNHRRAAILKAYLIRNCKKEVPVALDKLHPDEAYHLGRLFAALEKTQEDATEGKLNSTIKDRYFGAASATPATVFPRLMRLHQYHMNNLDNEGQRVNREKLIGEICGHLKGFPAHLPLERQGLFHIAYYHQRQDFFTKRSDNDQETAND